jgi:Lon protease-like protein
VLLPLFPLSVVLFPRTQLPLHIFEERYKEMIGEILGQNSEFGVVLATDRGIVNTGCSALVEEVTRRYDDGRLDLVSVGQRRFEILDLNDEKSYLRAAVEFFNDEETEAATDELKQRAIDGFQTLRQLADQPSLPEPMWDDPQLSFQLAQWISELDFQQTLLSMRSEAQRIQRLAEFFPGYVVRQQRVRHVRAVAPRNGHGFQPSIS